MHIPSNCLFVAVGWWLRDLLLTGRCGSIFSRRSCAGDFRHFLYCSPAGHVRQYVPLHYEQRRIPKFLFRGQVIEGDRHGIAHQALARIGYSYDQIDGLQPQQLIDLFEAERHKIGGDW